MSTHLRPIVITVAVMMCGLWAVADAAAQIPFLHRGRVEYRAFNDPGGRFAIEFPDGWQPVPARPRSATCPSTTGRLIWSCATT